MGWGLGTSRKQPWTCDGPKETWGRTLHSPSIDVSDIFCTVTCAEDGAKHSTQLAAWWKGLGSSGSAQAQQGQGQGQWQAGGVL